MCPIDPTIPLSGKTPNFYEAAQQGQQDAFTNQMNALKSQYAPQQMQQEVQAGDIKNQLDQISLANAKTDRALALAQSANPQNYQQVRQQAIQELGPTVANELPPVYDANAINNIRMNLLPIKDKLALQQTMLMRQIQMQGLDLRAQTLNENVTHHTALENAAGTPRESSLGDVVQQLESNGQRYGANGQLLVSPKGALGEMQVTPTTAMNPGFGVTPANPNNPDQLANTGRQYIQAMQTRYGDSAKALAAYNAGPGAVDKAIASAGPNGDWLSQLPSETQNYVKAGLAKLAPSPNQPLSTIPRNPSQMPTTMTAAQKRAYDAEQKQNQQKVKAQAAAQSYEAKVNNVTNMIDQVLPQIHGVEITSLPTAGFGAETSSKIPGTTAHDVAQTINSIKANLGF